MKTQNFTVHCLSCVRRLTMAIDCASWFGSKWMVYVIERQRAGGKFSTVCFVNYCCTQTQIQNINDVRYIYSCWRTRRHWRILANHRFAFVICTTAQIALLRPLMRQCWCFFKFILQMFTWSVVRCYLVFFLHHVSWILREEGCWWVTWPDMDPKSVVILTCLFNDW